MNEMSCGDPGSPEKRLKNFVPSEIETIADPVMERFVSTLQSYLAHSAEVIVEYQASIYFLNSNIGDVP